MRRDVLLKPFLYDTLNDIFYRKNIADFFAALFGEFWLFYRDFAIFSQNDSPTSAEWPVPPNMDKERFHSSTNLPGRGLRGAVLIKSIVRALVWGVLVVWVQVMLVTCCFQARRRNIKTLCRSVKLSEKGWKFLAQKLHGTVCQKQALRHGDNHVWLKSRKIGCFCNFYTILMKIPNVRAPVKNSWLHGIEWG